jgi:hypothetical protein
MAAKPKPTVFFKLFGSFLIVKPGEPMHARDDQKILEMCMCS